MDKLTDLKVYETTNYEQFVKLLGNRTVTAHRLSAIKESILRIGYQPSVILVNEKMEVIDGQGRLAACKDLGLPVLYTIRPGLSIQDCISMNIEMQNWKEKDYIECYAELGKDSYINLKKMMIEFPTLNWKQILDIGGVPSGTTLKNELRNGKLKFSTYNYTQYERARWISAMVPALKASGIFTNRAIEVLVRLDRYKLIDKKRMLDAVLKYGNSPEFAAYRANETLKALNDIYNYNRRTRTYFVDDYRRIADNMKEANLKKREERESA